ncbi:hypothetical protein ASPZODRAFT_55138 [Penicilliopsis zonata CBS 506.65]|uniref:Voltage-gated hydrogen channel 1 n=1 Tax=Penicilliopsis zonata CBS 506.65 TaxID=1073090 RepID=A0A1L9SV93_9EURO|nr:hypothetical protein ASPZODRAFT_55138 [Penicilliopsis zonata CBS 506.65]OJJ51108.1 hypothetical protein ASPZODRAFT_55138 [Penicilliopsis zonata CBS 506.65]
MASDTSVLHPLLGERRATGFLRSRRGAQSRVAGWRSAMRDLLSSRWGHYFVLLLVSVDVACIFADFLIELHVCGLKEGHSKVSPGWGEAQDVLDIISLVFSSLFMLELIVAALSFGKSYFASKFHIFDSLVILVAFIIDVSLHGVAEELGSIVVVLRLWRVFKIIEELSSASEEAMEEYEVEIERLRAENETLKRRLNIAGYSEAADGTDEL